MRRWILVCVCASLGLASAPAALAGMRAALDGGAVGLDSARDFRAVDGRCTDCATIPQALWYFQSDLIAVPKTAATGFSRDLKAQDDVRQWAAAHAAGGQGTKPPLLWIGSPQIAEGVRLTDAGAAIIDARGQRLAFAVTPKISSNLSYYDARSIHHFADRALRMRGRVADGRFVARTIWPEDYALDFAGLRLQPLQDGETLESLVRSDGDRPTTPPAARLLWQRTPKSARQWAGKPVLAFVLNGAQGDDDEAHGGHFAVATGVFGSRGDWGDWVVNNFYNLDSVSEKGIVASMVPMDNYMADLNSGQAWYRPSYMLVAVLKDERVARLYQEVIGRVYNHFYRHDFHYRHTSANCAGISIETLRSLGWNIPEEGPTSRLKAAVGLPYMAIKDMSLDSGRKAYDYMIAERTKLYPMVAFDAAGRDLQRLLTANKATTGIERMLAEDVEALIYVSIPQFPSSRAVGRAPVASIDEYMARVPKDESKWKIVPVPPRPFPAELADPRSPAEPSPASTQALYIYSGLLGMCGFGVWRRRYAKRSAK